jgi:hypothetical protein
MRDRDKPDTIEPGRGIAAIGVPFRLHAAARRRDRHDPRSPRHVDAASPVAQRCAAFRAGHFHRRCVEDRRGAVQFDREPLAFGRDRAKRARDKRHRSRSGIGPVDGPQGQPRAIQAAGRKIVGPDRIAGQRAGQFDGVGIEPVAPLDRRRHHPRRRAIDDPANFKIVVVAGKAQSHPVPPVEPPHKGKRRQLRV